MQRIRKLYQYMRTLCMIKVMFYQWTKETVQIMGYKKLLNYLKKLKWIKILNTNIQKRKNKNTKRKKYR